MAENKESLDKRIEEFPDICNRLDKARGRFYGMIPSAVRENQRTFKFPHIIHLILKGKWYDMIKSGEKKEEYREITDYWKRRLEGESVYVVIFHRGYTNKETMAIGVLGIAKGKGCPEWGAEPDKDYYVIRLLGRVDKERANDIR
jgi:hypothetical protein